MVQSRQMDTVLFFQSTRSSSWNAKLTGAYRYARERDWLLQVVPYSATPDEVRRALAEAGIPFDRKPELSLLMHL